SVPGGPNDPIEVIAARLAKLYVVHGEGAKATALYTRLISETRDPAQKSLFRRALVDAHRGAGTLADQVKALDPVFTATAPDENALRFLELAYANDGTDALPDSAAKRVAVYKRLLELHPADAGLRQALLAAYERAGLVDDGVAFIRNAPSAPVNSA